MPETRAPPAPPLPPSVRCGGRRRTQEDAGRRNLAGSRCAPVTDPPGARPAAPPLFVSRLGCPHQDSSARYPASSSGKPAFGSGPSRSRPTLSAGTAGLHEPLSSLLTLVPTRSHSHLQTGCQASALKVAIKTFLSASRSPHPSSPFPIPPSTQARKTNGKSGSVLQF